jgi:hypothetical protein
MHLQAESNNGEISPYTVMLTTNLEPVYGIVLHFTLSLVVRKKEHLFYIGCNYHHYGDIKWNH